MNTHDFIPEGDAAVFAGVSIKTLNRFAEAGYFKTETNTDGLKLFSRAELADLFGVVEKTIVKEVTLKSAPEPEAPAPVQDNITVATSTDPTIPETNSTTDDFISEWKVFGDLDDEPVQAAPEYIQKSSPQNPDEISRLKTLLELHERLLDLKEQQLKDAREQCEWLKTRVEKLEEKSDRDQLLLLSETQTVKKLVNFHMQRRSPVRAALEWFGFIPTSPSNTLTLTGQSIETSSQSTES